MNWYKQSMRGYYEVTPGMSISDVAKKWALEGERPMNHDEVVIDYPIEEIWPYREFEYSEDAPENLRKGLAYPFYEEGSKTERQQEHLEGLEKFRAMKQYMREYGFDRRSPILMVIGKDGKVNVGEGNHRLAAAAAVGLDTVPVGFWFTNTTGTDYDSVEHARKPINVLEDENLLDMQKSNFRRKRLLEELDRKDKEEENELV